MNEIIKKIKKFNNFENLVSETIKLVNKINTNQISIQVKDNNTDWTQSSGWLEKKTDEFLYKNIHPELKFTVFEEYLNSSEIPLFRTRILVLNPNNQYSLHKDPTPRVHIPIVTNNQNIFLFPDDEYISRMQADGSIYWCDTTRMHTFINYSKEKRIHIVSTVLI